MEKTQVLSRNLAWKGFLAVLLAAICFSSKGVMVKLAYQYQIDPVDLLFFRMFFSFPFYVVIGIWAVVKKGHPQVQAKEIFWVFLLGITGYYLSSLLDFMGLVYLSAGLERLILFVYPTMVVLINAWWKKEKISKQMTWSLLLSYAGILLVVVYDVSVKGTGLMTGVFLILLCALMFAFYLVFSDRLVHRFHATLYTSYMMIASSIGIFVHVACLSGSSVDRLMSYPTEVYQMGVLLAIVATVIPSYLMTYGIQTIGAGVTSITATLGPVSTMILAYWFLHEPITWVQWAGTALVVGGVWVAQHKAFVHKLPQAQ